MKTLPEPKIIKPIATPKTIGRYLFEFSGHPGQTEWIDVHSVDGINANASWVRGGRNNVKLHEWVKMGRWVEVS